MHSGGVWEGPWSLVSVTRMITPWMDQSHGMGPQMTLGGVEHCAVMCLVAQLYPTLCDPVDCSPPISSVHGDSPGKNASGLLCPPPGDHPTPGTEPRSPTLQADSLPSEPPGKTMIHLGNFFIKHVLSPHSSYDSFVAAYSPTVWTYHNLKLTCYE